eukprot:jgi/Tetstr1/462828/TSEL_007778.t1
MSNRTRKAGVGTTNREPQGSISPQKQRLGSFGKNNKEYLSALPNDLSRRMVSLRASWNVGDTQRSMKPSIRESLHWDADAPPLPAKETMLTRMGKPLTPEDAKFESLIDTLQFRMSQLAGGTAKKLFLHYDSNRSGYIDREEVRDLLSSMNMSLPDNQFDQLYEYMDAKGDGVVDYTEFCKSLVQQEKGDADDYFKGTGASQKSRPGASGSLFDADGEEGGDAKSHMEARKKQVKPGSYDPAGNMRGADLSYRPPDPAVAQMGRAATLSRSQSRKTEDMRSSVRVKGHRSGRQLLSMTQTRDLTRILRQKTHQKGQTLLQWFRWMDAGAVNDKAAEMSGDEFCNFLQEKLAMDVAPEQAEQLVEELGLGGQEPGSVNMQSFCEQFGPKSTAKPFTPDDEQAGDEEMGSSLSPDKALKAHSTRTLKRALSVKGAASLGEMEPVLLELAAQVQHGPTAVTHSEMLREFKQLDVERKGSLPIADFKRALGKAMAGTALKDLGMPDLSALTDQAELNYVDFVEACFDMGGRYGTAKGARITPLARYSPLDQINPKRQTLQADGLGTLSRSLLGSSSGRETARAAAPAGQRLAGPGWCDPRVDQIYKNTDYVTAPLENTPHHMERSTRLTTFKGRMEQQMLSGTQDKLASSCHPMQNIPEAKMRRLQEQRTKVEDAVWLEDQRPLAREAARIELVRSLNEAYRGNLRLDTTVHERHFNDAHPGVRFQPPADLHTLSRKSMLMSGDRRSANSLQSSVEASGEREPMKPYERLPFVGR